MRSQLAIMSGCCYHHVFGMAMFTSLPVGFIDMLSDGRHWCTSYMQQLFSDAVIGLRESCAHPLHQFCEQLYLAHT